jgi:hypothetical protein
MELSRIVQAALEAAGVAHRDASFILADRCFPGQALHVLFVFAGGQPKPSLIVKVASDPGVAAALRTEAANLARLAEEAVGLPRSTVPTLAHLGIVDGRVVQAQAALPGAPMTRQPRGYFDSPRFAQDVERIRTWLAAFGRACASDLPRASEARLPDGPAQAVAIFRERHRRSPQLDALLDRACAQLAAEPPDLAPRHGDFCAANVMVAGEGWIGVIDWEAPLERTWPLFDLVTFLASVSSTDSAPRTWLQGHRRLAYGAPPRLARVQAALQSAVREAGVGPAEAVALSALAWVVLANRKQAELDSLEAASGIRMPDQVHLPLVALEDGHCLNLEILAERRADYLLARG